jgi:hypothetical protein
MTAEEGQLHRQVFELRKQLNEVWDLLIRATPYEMGGRPKQFAPAGGWDWWEATVNEVLESHNQGWRKSVADSARRMVSEALKELATEQDLAQNSKPS